MADAILQSLTASNVFDLRGVVAVVTGGGKASYQTSCNGIGMMISSTLVANGATVYIVGPNQGDLDKVCTNYNAASKDIPTGGCMYGLEGDVRLKSEATRLATAIGEREKAVTVLFNNAGIHRGGYERRGSNATAADYVSAYFENVSQDDFTDVLNTNAVGPYWLTFVFLPLLERWKTADVPAAKKFAPQVIMTSSMNGWTKDSGTGGYSFPYLMSKSAIGHATSSLAHELLPLGIRVNGIAPGLFASQMTTGASDEMGRSTFSDALPSSFQVPVPPGFGSTRDMGTLVLFLLANWFVNGETVLIDGGTLLKHPSSY
ncbi:NAD(P)-binding protein [Favolaschia claudopus]|uniref:NAD(P)-binding protein n=1 Tax=Favolaschia claudopus TaxID=2862362 RepID=A0AAW0AU04_9AGAR